MGEKGKSLTWKPGLIEIIGSFTSCSHQILTAIFPFGSTLCTAHTRETQREHGRTRDYFFSFEHALHSFVIGKISITESNWDRIFGISVHSLVLVWYYFFLPCFSNGKIQILATDHSIKNWVYWSQRTLIIHLMYSNIWVIVIQTYDGTTIRASRLHISNVVVISFGTRPFAYVKTPYSQ